MTEILLKRTYKAQAIHLCLLTPAPPPLSSTHTNIQACSKVLLQINTRVLQLHTCARAHEVIQENKCSFPPFYVQKNGCKIAELWENTFILERLSYLLLLFNKPRREREIERQTDKERDTEIGSHKYGM